MDAAILSSLTLDVLQARLNEALDAKHQLSLGAQTVLVHLADQRVQFTPGSAAELDAYMAALHRAIRAKTTDRPLHAPIYLGFGGR
jgi:hypothetical protein